MTTVAFTVGCAAAVLSMVSGDSAAPWKFWIGPHDGSALYLIAAALMWLVAK